MSDFKKILDGLSLSTRILPLLHTCDVLQFREIARSSLLKTTACDVFMGENLVYCFYGKPSYRLGIKNSVSSISNFPVAFILDGEKLPSPKRLYPFDSGALSQLPEVKQKYFHPKINRDDFLLDNNFNSAKGIVEFFYGSNNKYYLTEPIKKPSDITATNMEAREYCGMINEMGSTPYDDRLAAIEFIFDSDIPINKDTLLKVILPQTFYDETEIRDVIEKEWMVTPETYYTVRGNPNEYIGIVLHFVMKYLKSNSFIV